MLCKFYFCIYLVILFIVAFQKKIASYQFFVYFYRLPAWGARQISRILGLKWKMKGHKNIVQNVGTVVLINHQSCIDLLGKYLFIW